MRRILAHGFALGLLLAPAAVAQSTLPSSLPGWNSADATVATSANLDAIAGELTPALVEYGVTAAEKRTYVREVNHRRTFAATSYSFRDASGAYGAYSFLHTPEMSPAVYSEYAVKSRDRVLVLVGSVLLDISGNGVESEGPTIKKLVALLADQKQEAVYPSLSLRLPTAGLDSRTEHYFLGPIALAQFWPEADAKGDWLGFSSGAEAETAKYRLKGGEAVLLIADYPTPQIAATQLERMSKQFPINPSDERAGGLYARRDGSLVALVAGAPSGTAASSLLEKMQSGVIITWNEPVLKHPQPSMAAIVVGTIIGTGEICLFTIVGGVVFTLIRLGVKRFFPGQIFDRTEQFEILEMGLSSKPIKGKDFY
ncbi:MAG TPA: DUF6599 family protein [Candidatus Acidoferrales bacterium]|nr:DUF6599 family protein [Candidatus Acidoferrales bacterium]